jgi:hypothetical protein
MRVIQTQTMPLGWEPFLTISTINYVTPEGASRLFQYQDASAINAVANPEPCHHVTLLLKATKRDQQAIAEEQRIRAENDRIAATNVVSRKKAEASTGGFLRTPPPTAPPADERYFENDRHIPGQPTAAHHAGDLGDAPPTHPVHVTKHASPPKKVAAKEFAAKGLPRTPPKSYEETVASPTLSPPPPQQRHAPRPPSTNRADNALAVRRRKNSQIPQRNASSKGSRNTTTTPSPRNSPESDDGANMGGGSGGGVGGGLVQADLIQAMVAEAMRAQKAEMVDLRASVLNLTGQLAEAAQHNTSGANNLNTTQTLTTPAAPAQRSRQKQLQRSVTPLSPSPVPSASPSPEPGTASRHKPKPPPAGVKRLGVGGGGRVNKLKQDNAAHRNGAGANGHGLTGAAAAGRGKHQNQLTAHSTPARDGTYILEESDADEERDSMQHYSPIPSININNDGQLPITDPASSTAVLDQLRLAKQMLKRKQKSIEQELASGESLLRQSGQVFAVNDLAREQARHHM